MANEKGQPLSLMKPPPSRYRVEERGGRLVVIDTQSGDTPQTARHLVGSLNYAPPVAIEPHPSDPSNSPGFDHMGRPIIEPAPVERAKPVLPFPPRPAKHKKPKPENPWANQAPNQPPRAVSAKAGVTEKPTVITTSPLYDLKAPRTIPLSSAKANQAVLILLATVFGLLIVNAMIDGGFVSLIVIFGFVFIGGRAQIRSAITKWLDAAERDSRL